MPGFPPGTTGSVQGSHYGDTSVAEDVTDIIYQITPEDTPFFNMTGDSFNVGAVLHEWQRRELTTRQHNAQPEGFTYTFTSGQRLPVRISNVLQIFQKDVRISETNQAINHYAIDDMFQDQMELKMVEMKTDKEHTLIQGTLNTGATNAARQMQGIISAIKSGVTTYTNFGGTNVTMTEDRLNAQVQLLWQFGSQPRDLLVNGRGKRKVSSFTSGGTRYIQSDEQRLVNTISVYETDFFPINTHLSRDIPADTTISPGYSGDGFLLLDKSMLKKAFLRAPTAKRIPETADSMDGVLKCELTLEWGHPNAHAFIDRALTI